MEAKQYHARVDYMSGKVTHREYHAQYVTWKTREVVLAYFKKRLFESKDSYFNDNTRLEEWDSLIPYLTSYPDKSKASCVCVLKEAGNQLRDRYLNNIKGDDHV